MSKGRFIAPTDVNMRQKVAVIGSQIAEDLFGLVDPVGQEIKMGGQTFKVIGILESANSMMGSNEEEIYIPITVAERLLQNRGVRVIYIQASSQDTVTLATNEISLKLSRIFKDNPDSDFQSFRIFDQTQMLDTVNQATGTRL